MSIRLLFVTISFSSWKNKKEANMQNIPQWSIMKNTKLMKNKLETLHHRWITHMHINSLASFSLRDSEILKIFKIFAAPAGWYKIHIFKNFSMSCRSSPFSKLLKRKQGHLHLLGVDCRYTVERASLYHVVGAL